MSDQRPERRRALAELDTRIQHAERTQARCRLDIADQAVAAKSTARTTAALRLADERLALLRESRRVLLSGHTPTATSEG